MAYQITGEKFGVYTKYFGFVTGEEFLQSVFPGQSDPEFERWRYFIKDFLQVTGHSVGPKDIKVAAIHGLGAEISNPNIKIAIVTADQGIHDLVTGFTALTHYPVDFFDTVADARVWMGQLANV